MQTQQVGKIDLPDGRSFDGVDLGNNAYAKVTSRARGKYDVQIFKTDGHSLSKTRITIDGEGGTISRLKGKDGTVWKGGVHKGGSPSQSFNDVRLGSSFWNKISSSDKHAGKIFMPGSLSNEGNQSTVLTSQESVTTKSDNDSVAPTGDKSTSLTNDELSKVNDFLGKVGTKKTVTDTPNGKQTKMSDAFTSMASVAENTVNSILNAVKKGAPEPQDFQHLLPDKSSGLQELGQSLVNVARFADKASRLGGGNVPQNLRTPEDTQWRQVIADAFNADNVKTLVDGIILNKSDPDPGAAVMASSAQFLGQLTAQLELCSANLRKQASTIAEQTALRDNGSPDFDDDKLKKAESDFQSQAKEVNRLINTNTLKMEVIGKVFTDVDMLVKLPPTKINTTLSYGQAMQELSKQFGAPDSVYQSFASFCSVAEQNPTAAALEMAQYLSTL